MMQAIKKQKDLADKKARNSKLLNDGNSTREEENSSPNWGSDRYSNMDMLESIAAKHNF